MVQQQTLRLFIHGVTMSDAEPNSPKPTFMDYHDLKFWLWACVIDAEEFLKASADFSTTRSLLQRKTARMRLDLTKYHFVGTMGSLVRHLRRIHSLFPSIQAAWDKAEHLRKEGKNLRDMIEHADEYSAEQGRKQEDFVRAAENVAINLPGDQPGIADATALILDSNGHWLGGRLNVERILAEVRAISAEAEKLSEPSG
jgi:hypothetical protein